MSRQESTFITVKEAERIESRSFMAALLALLCLFFAINYFFIGGPGSDGGSGLGGTGRFGGESGLGGTGKSPDGGSGLKLGAAHDDESGYRQDLIIPDLEAIQAQDLPRTPNEAEFKPPQFIVENLNLTPEGISLPGRVHKDDLLISLHDLDTDTTASDLAIHSPLTIDPAQSKEAVARHVLTSTDELLTGLMLAEGTQGLLLAQQDNQAGFEVEDKVRNRLSLPTRPERPDRLNTPTRITPVQRIDIPSAPPVRPMRTASALLGN